MARPTLDEIRNVKKEIWATLDKTKNKADREMLSYGIMTLQYVLDEKP